MASMAGYLSEDTIAAISTETGGAISIVRMSGSRTFSTLDHLTRANRPTSKSRKLTRAFLYLENDDLLDDCLFVRFENPNSYTGEDLVEFHLHGGGFIAHRLMDTLISLGIRQALPGEFSFRAVRNGKMSLFQAQAVSDLINAQNDHAVSLALEKLSGSQNQILQFLSASLMKAAVLGELGIDFADQDVEELSLPHLKKQLENCMDSLKKLETSYARGLRLQDGIRVAFVGLPNAGKSSFFNSLLGEDRSIVSEHAGTTRDVIRERLTLKGKRRMVTLRLEDTAGLRDAENPVEKIGIERTHLAFQEADLVLLIVDPNEKPELVIEQWNSLKPKGYLPKQLSQTLGIITKCDLLKESPLERYSHSFQPLGISKWVLTSAKTGEGISEAIEMILELTEHWVKRERGELILTRLDHFRAVQNGLEHLTRAKTASEIDLFAADVRQALHALAPLLGETVPDDILGRIFSDFCIGK